MSFHSISYDSSSRDQRKEMSLTDMQYDKSERQRQLESKQNHQNIDLQLLHNSPPQDYPMDLGVKKVFERDQGVPYTFHIPNDEPRKEHLKFLIESNGGFVSEGHYSSMNSDKLILVTAKASENANAVTPQYIEECVDRGSFSRKANGPTDDEKKAQKSRPNESTPNGASESKDVDNEPNNKSDDQDTAQTQATTNEDASEVWKKLASSHRSNRRFNAQKDEFILDEVRKRPQYRNSHSFFDELKSNPILHGHSGNSIRSRYRNHLQNRLKYIYKVDRYDVPILDSNRQFIKVGLEHLPPTLKTRYVPHDDYIMSSEIVAYMEQRGLKEGTNPPYSFYGHMFKKYPHHSLHSWRDHYRKYFQDRSALKYLEYYKKCEANGVTPLAASRDWANASTEPEPEKALDEEIGEIKNSNAHEVVQQATEVTMPIEKPQLDSVDNIISSGEESDDVWQENEPVSDDGDEGDGGDGGDGGAVIEYLPDNISIFSVISRDRWSRIRANPGMFVRDVVDSVKSGKSIYDVGFTKEFVAHVLMSSSNDSKLMHEFLVVVARNLVLALRHGKDPEESLSSIISTKGFKGMWDESMDYRLVNMPDELNESDESKERRKAFLKMMFDESQK